MRSRGNTNQIVGIAAMIDASKLNLQTKVTRKVSASDRFLYLNTGLGASFKPVEGTHYYATLYSGVAKREIVLVTAASGDMLEVQRGEDGTLEQEFPAGSCLIVEWNPAQLCEFVQTCVTGESPVMSPGVYCLECNTCITVDAYGRITKIDGVEKC